MTLDLMGSRDRRVLWTYRYHNANQQMDFITDPANRTTNYSWCNCGSLGSITDPKQQTTTFMRDLQGRVYQKDFNDNTSITYLYEGQTGSNTSGATSRLQLVTDAKGQRTNYTYFAGDSLTYDFNYNRVKTMADGIGNTVYAYNSVAVPPALGAAQLSSIDGPLSNDTITFSYDDLGRVINRKINGTNNSETGRSIVSDA
jgi:YD repeat-containing protein